MMPKAILFTVAALLATSAAAQSYRPDFQPSRLKGPAIGAPNQVLVLGTPHLRGLPPAFRPDALGPLIDRLARFAPQQIAIETLSGPQCDQLRRYPVRYKDTVESYCWDPAPARAATGLDVPAASAEVERVLAAWPATPTPAQRRRLAALFLASGDRFSALVQWLRLPAAERRAGDGLDAMLVEGMSKLATRRGEDTLIAAPLAARLGLERLVQMDDHTADAAVADEAAYGAAIAKAWTNPASARRRATDERLQAGLGTPDGLLALYRAYNAPGQGKLIFDGDFGAAMNERSAGQFGRGYLGYWETRNMRMAANIREALGERPGTRMLVIVGASHKGYLDAYLDQMHDVRLVDAAVVLR